MHNLAGKDLLHDLSAPTMVVHATIDDVYDFLTKDNNEINNIVSSDPSTPLVQFFGTTYSLKVDSADVESKRVVFVVFPKNLSPDKYTLRRHVEADMFPLAALTLINFKSLKPFEEGGMNDRVNSIIMCAVMAALTKRFGVRPATREGLASHPITK